MREGLAVDADWKRADLHPTGVDLAPIAAGDSARIGARDAVAEITGVGLGLKTNDIIGSKRAKDALITGQGAGDFRPRPGNMHEKADPVDAAQLAQDSRHRNEMIVVHPNDVVPAQHREELPGELLVHPEIGGGAAFRQIGEVEAVMTNRPKRLVGEAAIILFDIAA